MPVQPLTCPLCTGVLQIDSAWTGQPVVCPLCQGTFVVPDVTEPPLPPAGEAAITLACPSCSGPFQVLASMTGQQVLCPHCGAAAMVPDTSAGPPLMPPAFPPPPFPPPSSSEDRSPPSKRPLMTEASQLDLLPPGAFQRIVSTLPQPFVNDALPPAISKPAGEDETVQLDRPTMERAAMPPAPSALPPPSFSPSNIAPPSATPEIAPVVHAEPAANVTVAPVTNVKRVVTSEERSARRLRKNAVIFSFCLVVLIAVFYFLSQRKL